MKLNPIKVILFLLLCAYASVSLRAQETFIKRYKNTSLPEGSVAVANLPDKKIAVIGQQSNGFIWQSPMVIITDSAGNQLRHFVDTSCFGCLVYDGTTDNEGFIYVVGHFYGKAGIAKYDTSGNKIWQKTYNPFGLTSTFNCLDVINDSMLVAGGSEATDIDGGSAILVMFNANGDTIWSKYYPYSFETGINAIKSDYGKIYATGVISYLTQPQQRLFFTTVDTDGGNSYHYEINNGRKMGYGIVPLSPDSILIGGVAYNMYLKNFSFCTLVDSIGNELYTIQDSNYLFTNIAKIEWDSQLQILYTVSFDTVYNLGTPSPLPKISSYSLPLINLQQPVWEKTVYGTSITTAGGLALANDGTILHSGYASNNYCPYLLKADENTCADLACDTAFVSGLFLPDEENTPKVNLTLKLFPNPVVGEYLYFELHSDQPIKSISTSCTDVAGKVVTLVPEGEFIGKELYRGRIAIPAGLPQGIYLFRVSADQKYVLKGKFTKAD